MVQRQQFAADGASAPAPGSLCLLPLASAKTPSHQTPTIADFHLSGLLLQGTFLLHSDSSK